MFKSGMIEFPLGGVHHSPIRFFAADGLGRHSSGKNKRRRSATISWGLRGCCSFSDQKCIQGDRRNIG